MLKRTVIVIIGALTIMILSLTVCKSYAQTSEEETMRKGIDLTRHDKFDEAITEFNKAIAINPKSANAYYSLGFTYDKKGDLANAISNFSKAIEIDPALTDAYYNRGFAYYRKGAFDNAIADYNKLIEINPAYADAYYGLGLVYSKKGDLKKAIFEYTKAIEVRPNFALAYDARAVAYFTNKNYISAMFDVNKAQSLASRSRPPRIAQASLANAGKTSAILLDNESMQKRQMQTVALKIAGVIFLLVSLLQLLRLIFRVKVMVGKFIVPVWFSAIGFIITLFLSLWPFFLWKP